MQPARRLHAGWLCLPLGQDKVLFTEAGGVLHISSGERAACIHGCGTSQPDLRGGGSRNGLAGRQRPPPAEPIVPRLGLFASTFLIPFARQA